MAYIGNQPTVGNFVKLDAIVTSATDTFNLLNGGVAYSPQSANHCLVSLNGVIQEPTSASNAGGFTISGSTIVFTSALTSGDVIDFILVLGDVLNIGTPSDATVTFPKVTSNLITGATSESTIAGDDLVLIYDDSATALRKMTRTNFVAGIGATAGQVIQVVQGTSTTSISTSSSTYVTTNLSATITPSASANKILVICNFGGVQDTAGNSARFTIFKGATDLAGTSDGFAKLRSSGGSVFANCPMIHLDSPSTTSATTYTAHFKTASGTAEAMSGGSDGRMILLEIKG